MARTPFSAVVVCVLPLLGCAGMETMATTERYASVWAERLDEYRGMYVSRASRTREEVDEFVILVSRAREGPDAVRFKLKSVGDWIYLVAKVEGRARTLKRFHQAFEKRRSVGLMTAWVQREANDLADLDAASRRHIADFVKASKGAASAYDWYNEYEAVHKERGLIEGAARELSLLWTEVESYATDMAVARQIDRERRERFSRAMLAFSQYVFRQQMINALKRPRTCIVSGTIINCY